MDADLADEAFRQSIHRWLRSLPSEVIADLSQVYEMSAGIYPTTLLPLWREELRHRGIALAPNLFTANGVVRPAAPWLPFSHPLDSDWRFTRESARSILDLALSGVDGLAGPVVHLGTPSTFVVGTAGTERRQHILLERNGTVARSLAEAFGGSSEASKHRVIEADIRSFDGLEGVAAAAIADPPWYLEESISFLEVAATLCDVGATIVLCQPSLGTRPGVIAEREQLLAHVDHMGMEVLSVRSCFVRYVTPHFEAYSLKASAPVALPPAGWRRGDALSLRLHRAHRRSLSRPAPALDDWKEVHFGDVRIKVRSRPTGTDLGRIVHGDILLSVSRRDTNLEHVGLWTSGNRVFTLENTQAFITLINICNDDLRMGNFFEERTVQHAVSLSVSPDVASRLHALLTAEISEHQSYRSANQ